MQVPFIDLLPQDPKFQESLDSIISDVVHSGKYLRDQRVEDFEDSLSEYYNATTCVGVSSGFDALYLAMKAMGIGTGDEVITTSYSWLATAQSILLAGAKPVFIDIRKDDFNLNPDLIREKITPQTKMIIPVHLYGRSCDMDTIMSIAGENEILVVEDCAQAHGATFNNHKVGTYGDAGIFSFYPTKQLGALGDAGAVISNNEEMMQRVRALANHGLNQNGQFVERHGINSRIDSLQAAILTFKLKFLDEWLDRRRDIARQYHAGLSAISAIEIPRTGPGDTHYNYPVLVADAKTFQQALENVGVETGNNYRFTLNELFGGTSCPTAKDVAKSVVTLPLYPEMSSDQVDFVIQSVQDYFS